MTAAALASSRTTRLHARQTARSVLRVAPGCDLRVLDLDGSYVRVGTEQVLRPADVGIDERTLHLRAARLPPTDLLADLLPQVAETFASGENADP